MASSTITPPTSSGRHPTPRCPMLHRHGPLPLRFIVTPPS
ncbi:hypothetical protein LINPERHAP1_LOCUS26280 [Linum perenne]